MTCVSFSELFQRKVNPQTKKPSKLKTLRWQQLSSHNLHIKKIHTPCCLLSLKIETTNEAPFQPCRSRRSPLRPTTSAYDDADVDVVQVRLMMFGSVIYGIDR